jgi:putative Mg2+ transporter-C (MgtC) family protein
VILRDGLNVRGLNTAATLWCSAAVGSLAGAGLYAVALAGTTVVVGVNVLLRPLGRVVDRRPDSGDETPARYEFQAVTRDDAEAHVRALLVQALARTDFRLLSVLSTDRPESRTVEVRAELAADQRDDAQMESAVSRLSLEPAVSSVRWEAVPA